MTANPLAAWPSVELLLDAHATIAESPTWSPEHGALFWVDIKQPALHRLAPDGTRRHWELDSDVGAFALLDGTAGAVVALRTGLHRLDLGTGRTEMLAPPPFDPDLFRFNEGICDAQGRFWLGVMLDPRPGVPLPPAAAVPLHRFTLAGGLVEGPAPSDLHNSFAWSADGREFTWSHSYRREVFRAPYDPDTGTLGPARRFLALRDGTSIPDGAATDADGCLWCAMHGGGALHRFAPDGRLLAAVPLPVSQPTMCAFTGQALDELVVTSAADGLTPAQKAREPHAGGLFRLRPGMRGIPRPCTVR